MSVEEYAIPFIIKELARIRKTAPDEDTVIREWRKQDALYREHVTEGRGDCPNGNAIMTYYAARQAYFLYAQERGISLEVS